ncbi:MAG: hypothetical protein J3Q66DRAFT_391404 [Benniella sp.]|nr:MAG: hypothetical protein J3Q66DRAFT_391404 [Benniella sp.]
MAITTYNMEASALSQSVRAPAALLGNCANSSNLRTPLNVSSSGLLNAQTSLLLIGGTTAEGQPTSQLMKHFVRGTWPHLSELILGGIGFTDAQLAQVIGAMQDLKTLSVRHCKVGSSFLKALRPHSQTLTTLSMTFCEVSMPSLVPEIMASFPHLESLYAEAVTSQDFIDGPPWVCEHSLKVLGIEVSFSLNQGADYQRQVLQRISRLANLKGLLLDRGRRIEKGLDLRLENGLEQLATLKRLEKIEVHYRMEPFSECDVEWMINNWKSLKEVARYFRQKNKEELLSMFTAAGIKCRAF